MFILGIIYIFIIYLHLKFEYCFDKFNGYLNFLNCTYVKITDQSDSY